MCGYDFHRQKPLDEYIIDFFCNELMLAIEIDGLSYRGQEEYDKLRREKLESMGIKFLRFDDDEVCCKQIEKVLGTIEKWIKNNKGN
ncbi:MAG: endonuclease domain-containing protein [Bacteroidetes bacterium]|nr:endonuclease domain-containing protein [Bacteroidota bacterium]MBU2585695.1 endonuclease domain-containing protein [Bacteroidota bacterium]